MENKTDRKTIEDARISKETVKVISQGISGLGDLKDEVAAALASDAEYRVREIIQDASKFMRHSKRNTLSTEDINAALRLRNVEPLYGLSSPEPLNFVKVSGSTNLYFVSDNEVREWKGREEETNTGCGRNCAVPHEYVIPQSDLSYSSLFRWI